MSALAEILVRSGFDVTGSDLQHSESIQRLKSLGIIVHLGHLEQNIEGADAIVYSSAVPDDNSEISAAAARRIPVLHRSELLAEIMRMGRGIAVSGTHGKTTTSAIISVLLKDAGLEPTAVIGSVVNDFGSNALLGRGDVIVAEADESDGSFLRYPAVCSIVTNIDFDHMDHFKTEAGLLEAFTTFMNAVPLTGRVVACTDDPLVRRALKNVHRQVVTYGLDEEADICARHLKPGVFSVGYLKLAGSHNVLNSLAAVAVGLWQDVPFETISSSLQTFGGTARRLQWKGEERGVCVIDDYGHHPTEIAATLKACDETGRRVIVVFQPHRFTRTARMMDRMGQCFEKADRVFVLDVYSAGEDPIPGVDSARLAGTIRARGSTEYIPETEDLLQKLGDELKEGDLLLTLGAGDVWKVGEEFLGQNR
jgi:UDP-N-acetylmuramate--alanine ligase